MRNIVIYSLLIIIFYIISITFTFDPQGNTMCFLLPRKHQVERLENGKRPEIELKSTHNQ